MNKRAIVENLVSFPKNYYLADVRFEYRNHEEVTILRYQKNGKFIINGPRIVAIFNDKNILSLKNLTKSSSDMFLSEKEIKSKAENLFEQIYPNYFKQLRLMRLEHQERHFLYEDKIERIPVQWVKFHHQNGSFNWISLNESGEIIEMEIDSRWDFFKQRRKTEMWDNDDWILAKEGKGPQLPKPNALA